MRQGEATKRYVYPGDSLNTVYMCACACACACACVCVCVYVCVCMCSNVINTPYFAHHSI